MKGIFGKEGNHTHKKKILVLSCIFLQTFKRKIEIVIWIKEEENHNRYIIIYPQM